VVESLRPLAGQLVETLRLCRWATGRVIDIYCGRSRGKHWSHCGPFAEQLVESSTCIAAVRGANIGVIAALALGNWSSHSGHSLGHWSSNCGRSVANWSSHCGRSRGNWSSHCGNSLGNWSSHCGHFKLSQKNVTEPTNSLKTPLKIQITFVWTNSFAYET
jgi:hypothetical protein